MKPVEIYEVAVRVLKLDFNVSIIGTEDLTEHEKNINSRFFCKNSVIEETGEFETRLMVNEEVGEEYDTPRAKFRYIDFYENYGYAVNQITLDIFSALHEIGHAVFDKVMIDLGLEDLCGAVFSSTADMLYLKLNQEEINSISEKGPHIPTMIIFEEVWADNYALKNFPLVYNAVMKEIENGNVFPTMEDLNGNDETYTKDSVKGDQ